MSSRREFIQTRKSQLNYYRAIPLYYRNHRGVFVLYKPPGVTLLEMRVQAGRIPDPLYIRSQDKVRGIQEAQQAFNSQLKEDIASRDPEKVRTTLSNIVAETLSEPRSGSLEGVSETVGIIVSEYARETDVIRNLLDVSSSDYTTVMHSINVMALVLGYANFAGYPTAKKKVLGLSGLLHDVGKTRTDPEILKAARKLSDEEFKQMQRHTILGYNILNRCRFGDPEIKLAALQHHEKTDGSGYPNGLRSIPESSQIIGLIDCYEALTNDDRPYRSAMAPMKALKLIRKDVEAGKFSRKIFERFAYSLVMVYRGEGQEARSA